MATPGMTVAARQAASGFALRALPRRKTYTTSWDINRARPWGLRGTRGREFLIAWAKPTFGRFFSLNGTGTAPIPYRISNAGAAMSMLPSAAKFLSPLAALLLAACGGPSSERSADSVTVAQTPASAPHTSREGERKVALVVKTLTNPFFVEVEAGARRAERELGVKLIVKSASQETSIEQQVQIVEDLVRDKVDAIVIAPGDSQRLVAVLKRAQDAGIAVVNIDNQLDPATVRSQGLKTVPFVSVDNKRASYQAAKFVADSITKPTQVIVIEGIRSADNAQQRTAGFEQAINENKNLRVVAKVSANWKIDEGYAATQQAFASHPNIGAVFAANDMMALGALRYLAESRRAGVRVVAYDAIPEARDAVKAGALAVTVDQQAAEQGYQGVALAVRALASQSLPETMLVDAKLVTAQTLMTGR